MDAATFRALNGLKVEIVDVETGKSLADITNGVMARATSYRVMWKMPVIEEEPLANVLAAALKLLPAYTDEFQNETLSIIQKERKVLNKEQGAEIENKGFLGILTAEFLTTELRQYRDGLSTDLNKHLRGKIKKNGANQCFIRVKFPGNWQDKKSEDLFEILRVVYIIRLGAFYKLVKDKRGAGCVDVEVKSPGDSFRPTVPAGLSANSHPKQEVPEMSDNGALPVQKTQLDESPTETLAKPVAPPAVPLEASEGKVPPVSTRKTPPDIEDLTKFSWRIKPARHLNVSLYLFVLVMGVGFFGTYTYFKADLKELVWPTWRNSQGISQPEMKAEPQVITAKKKNKQDKAIVQSGKIVISSKGDGIQSQENDQPAITKNVSQSSRTVPQSKNSCMVRVNVEVKGVMESRKRTFSCKGDLVPVFVRDNPVPTQGDVECRSVDSVLSGVERVCN